MTLIIENVKAEHLPALENFTKSIQATLKTTKEYNAPDEYSKDFLKSLDECEREFEEQRKNGTLKLYNSVEEAFKAEGII
ncbi:hypothetical protein [uncultured Helicobacter sp.]|uniref:hypothetical protein n=1 Tax=uncultured Helicobacter sp. TaxID=175537 RepID=UPI00374F65B3